MTLKRAFIINGTTSYGDKASGIVYYEGDKPDDFFDYNLHVFLTAEGWHLSIEGDEWVGANFAMIEQYLREWATDYPDFPAPIDNAEVDVMASAAIGATYAELVGYNPFEDDRTMAVQDGFNLLMEYQALAAEEGVNLLDEMKARGHRD